jgi:hypothetical protein
LGKEEREWRSFDPKSYYGDGVNGTISTGLGYGLTK